MSVDAEHLGNEVEFIDGGDGRAATGSPSAVGCFVASAGLDPKELDRRG